MDRETSRLTREVDKTKPMAFIKTSFCPVDRSAGIFRFNRATWSRLLQLLLFPTQRSNRRENKKTPAWKMQLPSFSANKNLPSALDRFHAMPWPNKYSGESHFFENMDSVASSKFTVAMLHDKKFRTILRSMTKDNWHANRFEEIQGKSSRMKHGNTNLKCWNLIFV